MSTKKSFASLAYLSLSVSILVSLTFNLLSPPPKASAYGSSGGRIVYTGNLDGSLHGDIFIMNPDGSNKINLTNSSGNESSPSWSPDGSKILFTKGDSFGVNTDIFIMNPDGSGVTNITNSPKDFYVSPIWSPDGRYIRFIANSLQETNKFATFTIEPDGTNLVEMPILINPTEEQVGSWAYDFQPWSPDGTRMIIPETFSNGMRLYIIKPDGTDQVQISGFLDGYNWAYAQAWSPDGTKIFFEEYGDGTSTNHKIVSSSDGSVISQQSITRSSSAIISNWRANNEIIYSAKEEGDSFSINLYKMAYNTDEGFSSPLKLTDYLCQQEECGVSIFDVSQERVVFSEILPLSLNESTEFVADVYSIDSFSSPNNLTNNIAPEGSPKLAISHYNVMEPMPGLAAQPVVTPTTPKTGKIIGATIATISMIAVILLLAKEIKEKHHKWGGER